MPNQYTERGQSAKLAKVLSSPTILGIIVRRFVSGRCIADGVAHIPEGLSRFQDM